MRTDYASHVLGFDVLTMMLMRIITHGAHLGARKARASHRVDLLLSALEAEGRRPWRSKRETKQNLSLHVVRSMCKHA